MKGSTLASTKNSYWSSLALFMVQITMHLFLPLHVTQFLFDYRQTKTTFYLDKQN